MPQVLTWSAARSLTLCNAQKTETSLGTHCSETYLHSLPSQSRCLGQQELAIETGTGVQAAPSQAETAQRPQALSF